MFLNYTRPFSGPIYGSALRDHSWGCSGGTLCHIGNWTWINCMQEKRHPVVWLLKYFVCWVIKKNNILNILAIASCFIPVSFHLQWMHKNRLHQISLRLPLEILWEASSQIMLDVRSGWTLLSWDLLFIYSMTGSLTKRNIDLTEFMTFTYPSSLASEPPFTVTILLFLVSYNLFPFLPFDNLSDDHWFFFLHWKCTVTSNFRNH